MASNIVDIVDSSLKNWTETFEKQNHSNSDNKFVFYEGPPFATGKPHYGHILNGIIKDAVCRWKIMSGYNVPRNAGWDCHGLPIENKMEDKYGIKSKNEIINFGIENYNNKCREMVFECVEHWKEMAEKIGRWIDFENDYKTMSKEYMECVWNVFKRIYDKDFIYRGFRVMPYSVSLGTPLSNFEASSNYKDTRDTCATVKFKLKTLHPALSNISVSMLVWTTTPWTLPSNTALAVNNKLIYVVFRDNNGENFICSRHYYNSKLDNSENIVCMTLTGNTLVGSLYKPVFEYNKKSKFPILHGDFVSEDKGTGIVHLAPSFGEDDFNLCVKEKVLESDFSNLFMPVDNNGKFTSEVPEYQDRLVFDTNDDICKSLKDSGLLYKKESIVHSYPFCWRSDTKLMYRAVDSWFIKVSDISDRLVKNNSKVNWIPGNIGKERFNNWLENAKDWNFSRKRYWGCPIPIWVNENDSTDIIVVGSVEELNNLSGVNINDLHRETVDKITINIDDKVYRRIEDVMDCWFESGSMPYAKDGILNSKLVPAEFICEGLDQTRGWFYTLLVISTILDDKAPYKNVIVNGLVLAEDGKKMSKRLNNYPDPIDILRKYGGDSLRYYLLFSGASYANSLCFKDSEVRNINNNIINSLYNSCNFYTEYLNLAIQKKMITDSELECLSVKSDNVSDIWIMSLTYSLFHNISSKINKYELKNIGDMLLNYIDNLSNVYIRINRDRFRESDKLAIKTLYVVLHNLSIIMASFTPFISEYIFNNIGFSESVHNKLHTSIIKPCDYSEEIIRKFEVMIKLMDNIRRFRTRNNITGKIPIKNLSILVDSSIPTDVVIDSDIKPYLLNECNILDITYEVKDNLYKIDKYIPNFKDFKQDLGVQCLIQIAKDANNNCLKDTYQKENREVLTPVVGEHIKRKISINKKYLSKNNQISIEDSRVVLNFDTDLDANVQDIYVEKQILANIQQKRKLDKYDITQYLNVRILCSKIDRNSIKLPNIYQTNNIEIREVEEIMDDNKFRIETFDSYIDINIILDEHHQISNSAVY